MGDWRGGGCGACASVGLRGHSKFLLEAPGQRLRSSGIPRHAAANIRLITACVEEGERWPAALRRPAKLRMWPDGTGSGG